MVEYRRLTRGLLGSNTYLVWDSDSRECALIDAGNPTRAVQEIAVAENLKVCYIILTHAHYDHIFYFEEYRKVFPEAASCAHRLDDEMLPSPRLNASAIFGPEKRFARVSRCLEDGDTLPLGKHILQIIHTPGHTPGGISIRIENLLFTGDTLFYDGFGRTDLGAGSTQSLSASIARLYDLDPDLTVLPGHGTKTTIGREARENPFMDF